LASPGEKSSRRKSRRPPATTPESRENQLIDLAVDLAEEQLAQGNASAQVITHYLKLGTTRERLEQERLKNENKLLTAKVEALASASRVEELYEKAVAAMRRYSGQSEEGDGYQDQELHRTLPDRGIQ
jgi:hypothetical protein